jgi:hypothetical protein
MAIQIDCIEKEDRHDPATAITHVGGRNSDGSRWRITQNQAIDGIIAGKWSFFVSNGIRRVNVVVSTSRFGNKYIKTESDDYEPNNLLDLNSCKLVA